MNDSFKYLNISVPFHHLIVFDESPTNTKESLMIQGDSSDRIEMSEQIASRSDSSFFIKDTFHSNEKYYSDSSSLNQDLDSSIGKQGYESPSKTQDSETLIGRQEYSSVTNEVIDSSIEDYRSSYQESDLGHSMLTSDTQTAFIEESILWKPEISTLILQNIKNVARSDITDKLGNDIHKKAWKLIVKRGVEILGASLMESSNVKEVLIADSVKVIEEKCFNDCQSLVRLRLPNGLEKIESKAFAKCTSLQSIIFPNKISYLGSHLIEGSGIKNATLLNTTIKVENIELYVFAGAKSMTSFHYCGDTYYAPVNSIYAFQYTSVFRVKCPMTYNVIFNRGYYFLMHAAEVMSIDEHCQAMENAQFADIDWKYESTHGDAPNPTQSPFPTLTRSPHPTPTQSPHPTPSESPWPTQSFLFDEYPVYLNKDNYALVFQEIEKVTKADFLHCDLDEVIENTKKLVVKPGVKELDDNLMENAITLEIVLLADSVELIGKKCFRNCRNLKKIRLSKNLYDIGDSAFENTNKLKEIILPGKLGILGEYLIRGSGIITATMLNTTITPYYVKSYSFGNASFLKDYYYCGDKYLYHKTESLNIFIGSKAMEKGAVAVPLSYSNIFFPYYIDTYLGWNVKKMDIKDICDNASSFLDAPIDWDSEIAQGVKRGVIQYNKESGSIDSNLFYISSKDINTMLAGTGRDKITALNLRDGVENLGYHCMEDCIELTEVKTGNTLKSIYDYCFNGCVKLKSIKLPKAIEYIGDYAFSNFHSLKQIIIPANVENIGFNAFKGSGMQNIIYLTPNIDIQSVSIFAFGDIPDIKSFIYCGLMYQNHSRDSYIDKRVSVTVDYLYKKAEFLGRTLIRDNVRQTCIDSGDYSTEAVGIFNPLIFSTVISVILVVIVVITVILLFIVFSEKAAHIYLEQEKKSDSSGLINLSIDEEF